MKRDRRLGVCLCLLLAVGAAWEITACAGATGGKRFTFEAYAGGAASGPGRLAFENERGWTITLSRANVTVGPIYLNVVSPLADTTQALWGLLVKNAWAHGEGHLDSGRIVGEVLSQLTFDALSPELVPFPSPGSLTQEQVRTAEIWFFPEPGIAPDTTRIDTVALDVAGEATRGGVRVPFRGALVLNDAWQPTDSATSQSQRSIAELRKVRGIVASFVPTEGGQLEIRVDVRSLFRGADFSNLETNPSDRDGTRVLVQSKAGELTTDQVMQNLYQGLRASTGTYSVTWREPGSK